MWEYRIFSERDFKDKISHLVNFEKTTKEKRTDYYYDFHFNQYGLKERLSDTSKLELKIRLDKNSDGIEYWEKVISHPYPDHHNSHLPFYQIEDIISQEADENQIYGSDIEYFQEQISTNYQITKVSKIRWESELLINDTSVDVEYGIVEIHGEKLYSFSIESDNLELMQELIREWDLMDSQFSGGYPSLVRALNETVKLTIR